MNSCGAKYRAPDHLSGSQKPSRFLLRERNGVRTIEIGRLFPFFIQRDKSGSRPHDSLDTHRIERETKARRVNKHSKILKSFYLTPKGVTKHFTLEV